jgi:hypothetical protein
VFRRGRNSITRNWLAEIHEDPSRNKRAHGKTDLTLRNGPRRRPNCRRIEDQAVECIAVVQHERDIDRKGRVNEAEAARSVRV